MSESVYSHEKPYTCNINGCGKQFTTRAAKDDHRVDVHGAKRKLDKRYIHPSRRKAAEEYLPPLGGWDSDDVYDFVDSLDLPDGAHWAMIEELSGLEPGDFA